MNPKTLHVLLLGGSTSVTVLSFWQAWKVFQLWKSFFITDLIFGVAMAILVFFSLGATIFLACMLPVIWSRK